MKEHGSESSSSFAGDTPAPPEALRMAYADPPYPGQAKAHYAAHPDYDGEVDHAELIAVLVEDYPDGWALSTASTTLRDLLPRCPPETRVMAWVKPFCSWRGAYPPYAWEPVLLHGGRKPPWGEGRARDWVAATPPAFRRIDTGVHGTKPEEFCFWLFEAMGLRPWDEFDDLFPGSGAVARAWRAWSGRPPEDANEQAALDLEAA